MTTTATTKSLTPAERADIVSGLAKGFRIDQIASSLKVPTAAVLALRNEYGTDLGQLATAAEQLRTDLGSHHPTADDTLILLEKAAALPSLATKALRAIALVNDIRTGLAEAEEVAKLEAIARKRRADLADAEKALAEAKKIKPKASVSALDPATIRAWAADQGIHVAPAGRVPQSVVDAYKAAQS
jgi:hypothetical protein